MNFHCNRRREIIKNSHERYMRGRFSHQHREKSILVRGTNIFLFLMAILFILSWFYFLSTIDHGPDISEDVVPPTTTATITNRNHQSPPVSSTPSLGSNAELISTSDYDKIYFNLKTVSPQQPIPQIKDVTEIMSTRAQPGQCETWVAHDFDFVASEWIDWKTGMSASGQDRYLAEQLFSHKKNGVFIDIGAGDGETYSNSWLLEKCYRWSGICFEPGDDLSSLVHRRDCIAYRGGATLDKTGNCYTDSGESTCFNLKSVLKTHGVKTLDLIIINRKGHNLKSIRELGVKTAAVAVEDGNYDLLQDLAKSGYQVVKRVGAYQFFKPMNV
jgi:hypothetical protein